MNLENVNKLHEDTEQDIIYTEMYRLSKSIERKIEKLSGTQGRDTLEWGWPPTDAIIFMEWLKCFKMRKWEWLNSSVTAINATEFLL